MKRQLFTRFSVTLVVAFIAVLVMAVLAPLPVSAQDSSAPTATVTAWALNVRAGPGTSYQILDTLPRGERVELVGYRTADATWVQMRTADGTIGWMSARYLQSDFPFMNLAEREIDSPDDGGSVPMATVTAYALNVRRGPGVTFPVTGWLVRGQQVELAGYRNADASWVQVRLPDGTTGWVSARYLRSEYPFANLAVPGGPGDNLAGTQPAQVVESFYSWYLEYARETGNPLVDRAYRTQTHLTPEFIERLDRMVAEGLQADPILLAQDVPGEIRIGSTSIDGTTATVVVHEIWNPTTDVELVRDITVLLRQLDGRWKIDDVRLGS